jgi:hypothetical protein
MLRLRPLTAALAATLLLTAVAPSPAHAELSDIVLKAMEERALVLVLADGTEVRGKLVGHDAATLVLIAADGKVVTVEREKVTEMRADTQVATPAPTPPPTPAPSPAPAATTTAAPPPAAVTEQAALTPPPVSQPWGKGDEGASTGAKLKQGGATLLPIGLAVFGGGFTLLMLHEGFVLSDGPSFHLGFGCTVGGAGMAGLGIPLLIAGSQGPEADARTAWVLPVLGFDGRFAYAGFRLTLR